MFNDQGELKEFAIVIPVPSVLEKGQIHVANKALIDHLDAYTSPRLVEYFDENPCDQQTSVRGPRDAIMDLRQDVVDLVPVHCQAGLVAKLDAAQQQLEQSLHKVAEVLYQAQAAEHLGPLGSQAASHAGEVVARTGVDEGHRPVSIAG